MVQSRFTKRGFLLDAAPQEGAELVYSARITNSRLLSVVADRSPDSLLFQLGYSSQTKNQAQYVTSLNNPPAVIQVGAVKRRDAENSADASKAKVPKVTRPPGAAPAVGEVPGVADALEDADKIMTVPPELGGGKDLTKQDDDDA